MWGDHAPSSLIPRSFSSLNKLRGLQSLKQDTERRVGVCVQDMEWSPSVEAVPEHLAGYGQGRTSL